MRIEAFAKFEAAGPIKIPDPAKRVGSLDGTNSANRDMLEILSFRQRIERVLRPGVYKHITAASITAWPAMFTFVRPLDSCSAALLKAFGTKDFVFSKITVVVGGFSAGDAGKPPNPYGPYLTVTLTNAKIESIQFRGWPTGSGGCLFTEELEINCKGPICWKVAPDAVGKIAPEGL